MTGRQQYSETLVIGGGQAGLAVGHHLTQRGLPFLIVDANQRVGDAWRKRWDSLRLFTPRAVRDASADRCQDRAADPERETLRGHRR